jgi:hypothetical protein
MRAIFPFWTYETHRLFWLSRMWLKTPGTFTATAKYHDYTDQGYIHIPGWGLEINPLRGTIWMGGMRRLILRDFPDYYDRFPKLANTFDQLSRFGFFPNIFVSTGFAVFGAAKGRSQVGELLPPVMQMVPEGIVAAFPESRVAKFIQETLLPSRFRDYIVAQKVSEQGNDGVGIRNKLYTDTPLTDEDQRQWQSGQRGASLFNFLAMNTGLFRLRPDQRIEFVNANRILIEEMIGIPVDTQIEMGRAGMRIGDFIPVSPEVRDALNELEGATHWKGQTEHLRESQVGQNMARVRQFWSDVEDFTDIQAVEHLKLDTQWRTGEINLDRWKREKRELNSTVVAFIDQKKADPQWQMELDGKTFPIPVTLDERRAFALAQGTEPTLLAGEDELIALYFQVELEDTYDIELGAMVTDWDKFFNERRFIESGIVGPTAEHFKKRIRANETELSRHQREDMEQYLRPYFNSFDLILEGLPEDEQRIIRRAAFTDDADERIRLLAEVGEDGKNIVSNFQTTLSHFRKRLRQLAPEMDARLVLWAGRRPVTNEALEIWRKLRAEYGFSPAETDPLLEQ